MHLPQFVIKILKIIGLFEILKDFKFRKLKDFYLRYLPLEERKYFIYTGDPVRYGAIGLAIKRITKNNIHGSFAEVGVYKGATSRIIHMLAPEKRFYLFDTFEGFPEKDLEHKKDDRFKETSVELVKKTIGDANNIVIKKGYFPDTTIGLEDEKFSFVMLDVDLYNPTLKGLEFFYPRIVPGGYLFVHDYNSYESNYAVSQAVDEFMANKPEKLIEIPDKAGSVIIRKI